MPIDFDKKNLIFQNRVKYIFNCKIIHQYHLLLVIGLLKKKFGCITIRELHPSTNVIDSTIAYEKFMNATH